MEQEKKTCFSCYHLNNTENNGPCIECYRTKKHINWKQGFDSDEYEKSQTME